MWRQGRANDLRASGAVQGVGMVCDGLREEVVGRFEIRVEVGFRRQGRFLKRLRIEGQRFGNKEGIEGESGVGIEDLRQEMKLIPTSRKGGEKWGTRRDVGQPPSAN